MCTDIKSLLIRVCGTISYLIVIFFFVTFILFLHNDIKDALKEAWSVSVSFLSVLSTLGAAIIAANLFNDWKLEQNHQSQKEFINNIIKEFRAISLTNHENIEIFQGIMAKYRSPNDTLPVNHKDIMLSIFRVQAQLSGMFVTLQIEVQNYGIISNNKEFSKIILKEIKKIEKTNDDLFNVIKEGLTNQSANFFLESIKNYHKNRCIEQSAKIYEVVIIPLLDKIRA